MAHNELPAGHRVITGGRFLAATIPVPTDEDQEHDHAVATLNAALTAERTTARARLRRNLREALQADAGHSNEHRQES